MTPINKAFRVPEETIYGLLTAETLTSEAEMILRVKKPDYLGQSMWEFRHETRIIPAKILDAEWLARFHNREVVLRPRDSIRVKIQTAVYYDRYGEVVATHYAITQVLAVIAAPTWGQGELYPDETRDG